MVNSILLAGVMALSGGRPLWEVLWVATRASALPEVAMSVVASRFTALRRSRLWVDEGPNNRICLNVSLYDLRNAGFPDLVAERLTAHGLTPSVLGIDVTETT